MLTPQQFGAVGDGQPHPLSSVYGSLTEAQAVYPFAVALTDELDWCGIQKAINTGRYPWAAGQWDLGMRVVVPPGSYRLNRTVQIRSVRSLVIEGDGLPIIRWHGDDASPMFRYTNANACEMKRLWLMHGVSTPNAVLSAIDLERGDLNTWTPSANLFQSVQIGGFNLGTFRYGCRVLTGEGGDANNDYHKWLDCHFDSYSEAALLVSATQAHEIHLERCGFGGARSGKCAVRSGATLLRLHVVRCGGGGHTEMDFDLRTGNHQTTIDGWNSENSTMLVQAGTGPNSNPFQLRLSNVRWEPTTFMNADGIFIKGWGPGPLVIRGLQILPTAGIQPQISWQSNWTGAEPATVLLEDVTCNGTDDAFDLVTPLERLGCVVQRAGCYRWSPNKSRFVGF